MHGKSIENTRSRSRLDQRRNLGSGIRAEPVGISIVNTSRVVVDEIKAQPPRTPYIHIQISMILPLATRYAGLMLALSRFGTGEMLCILLTGYVNLAIVLPNSGRGGLC